MVELATAAGPAVTTLAQGFQASCVECGWVSPGIDVDQSFADSKRDAHNRVVHPDFIAVLAESQPPQYAVVARTGGTKTQVVIVCPFCDTETPANPLALASKGERCSGSTCDALFLRNGTTALSPN